jgi:hypothetical protein
MVYILINYSISNTIELKCFNHVLAQPLVHIAFVFAFAFDGL